MRALLFIGSLAVGVLYLIYENYRSREEQYAENQHRSSFRGRSLMSEEENIDVGSNQNATYQLPEPTDICCICQDALMLRNTTRRYCIIALPRCKHWFHQRCALRLLEYHPYCPVCRDPIDSSMLRARPMRLVQDGVSTTTPDDSMTSGQSSV